MVLGVEQGHPPKYAHVQLLRIVSVARSSHLHRPDGPKMTLATKSYRRAMRLRHPQEVLCSAYFSYNRIDALCGNNLVSLYQLSPVYIERN